MSNKRLVAILGISTQTLYKYFKDKENLLSMILELFYNKQYETFKKLSKDESAVIVLYNLWKQGFKREYEVNSLFYYDLHYYYPEVVKSVFCHKYVCRTNHIYESCYFWV